MPFPRSAGWGEAHVRGQLDFSINYQEKFMNTRRSFVFATGAVLAAAIVPTARAGQELPPIIAYKSPACGCCGEWVKHMQSSGFRVETQEVADVTPIKRKYGVPEELWSCHTAVVGGYAIEGHVPAVDVKRLLREGIEAKGLAVPGMVAGSPGMEQGQAKPYATIVFDERGSKVFERH